MLPFLSAHRQVTRVTPRRHPEWPYPCDTSVVFRVLGVLNPGDRLACGVEASERLVGSPVFKTGEGLKSPWQVRFLSASARNRSLSTAPLPRAWVTPDALLE